MRTILSKSFFNRQTLKVAEELLGKFIVKKNKKEEISAMITEVEVYDGFEDGASLEQIMELGLHLFLLLLFNVFIRISRLGVKARVRASLFLEGLIVIQFCEHMNTFVFGC